MVATRIVAPVSSVTREIARLVHVEHGDGAEIALQRLAIRVAAVAQRGQRLGADGVGRGQPEHQGLFGVEKFLGQDARAVCGDQRLAAASGDANADVGQVGQFGHGAIGNALVKVFTGDPVECLVRVAHREHWRQ